MWVGCVRLRVSPTQFGITNGLSSIRNPFRDNVFSADRGVAAAYAPSSFLICLHGVGQIPDQVRR